MAPRAIRRRDDILVEDDKDLCDIVEEWDIVMFRFGNARALSVDEVSVFAPGVSLEAPKGQKNSR